MRLSTTNISCPSCGGSQVFLPSSRRLSCEFCHQESDIVSNGKVTTRDYLSAINSSTQESKTKREVACKRCGASFIFKDREFASRCPYCDTPTMIEPLQEITPNALIPFTLSQRDAQKRFKIWVGSRWFAPNAFKEYLEEGKKLIGRYIPYWGYDTHTISHYQGERGDSYYVTVTKRVEVNGKMELRSVQEERVSWSSASGVIDSDFRDVTVGATTTIDPSRLDSISPWHSSDIHPFDLRYISGFKAEEYTIELKDGFDRAKREIDSEIRYMVKSDIGGDYQRIHNISTEYKDIGYKALLFPIWSASFDWNNKTYEYAINAQTGKIVGERPYSYTKIVFAVVGVAVVVGIGLYFGYYSGK